MRSPVRVATAELKCAVLCVSSQSGWLCMAESKTGTSAACRMSGRARVTSCTSGSGIRSGRARMSRVVYGQELICRIQAPSLC